MRLYIDIGNSSTKFGIDDGESVKNILFFASHQIKQNKKTILKVFNDFDIDKIFVSSVAPKIYKELKKVLPHISIYTITPREKVDFEIKIDNPDELGTDLLCDLSGAYKICESPTLIVDLGTATKVLYAPKNKIFTSCAIVPGVEISQKLLANATELLNENEFFEPKDFLECHNTKEVINSSIIFSHVDIVNGLINKYEKEIGMKANVIITGGCSKYLFKYLSKDYLYEPNLSLIGLKNICKDK